MGYIDLVRCVLVLRCGMVVVVWYPYAGFSLHTDIGSFFILYSTVVQLTGKNTELDMRIA